MASFDTTLPQPKYKLNREIIPALVMEMYYDCDGGETIGLFKARKLIQVSDREFDWLSKYNIEERARHWRQARLDDGSWETILELYDAA